MAPLTIQQLKFIVPLLRYSVINTRRKDHITESLRIFQTARDPWARLSELAVGNTPPRAGTQYTLARTFF